MDRHHGYAGRAGAGEILVGIAYEKHLGRRQAPAPHDPEESLRIIAQSLLDVAGSWAKEERVRIDHLFRRALYLFIASMSFFVIIGIVVAFYISLLFTAPLVQMQQAMDEFRRRYNHVRPHEALGQLPPITRYEPSAKPRPKTLPPVQNQPVAGWQALITSASVAYQFPPTLPHCSLEAGEYLPLLQHQPVPGL